MSTMFWGLRLEPGKRYSTTVDKSFHVSMAALDCASVKSDNEILSVMIDEGESGVPFILCNLQKTKLMQAPLDLNFMTGDRITIFCKGNGVIHLSGYIVPEEEDEGLGQLGEDDDDEEEDDDEETEEVSDSEIAALKKDKGSINGLMKRKADLKGSQAKRKKLDEDSEDSDDDLASDDVEDDSMGLEGEESDDDEEDDDDEESEEESEEENSSPSRPQQQTKKNKPNKANQQQQTASTNKQQQNQGKQGAANLKKQQNQGKQQKTPNGVTPNVQSKKDKKKGDKTSGATTPAAKLNKSNDESSSPVDKKAGGDAGSPGKKTLDGGVSVKDIKVGNGPPCKPGKTACVYYTGRFKQNNKVFDSTTQGSGFKFRVGKNEVIKGWDVGVVGMKVGGKRLITCPPHMAYGQKGSPPTIPGNSTLVFEVELKSVN